MIILVSSIELTEKLKLIYRLFDFGRRDSLTLDEMVILLHSVATGANKLDPAVPCPELEVLEILVKRTFRRVGKTIDEEITPGELEIFCQLNSQVANVVSYITGAAQLGRIPAGQRWHDHSFDDLERVLYGETPSQHPAHLTLRPFGVHSNFTWREPPPNYVVIVPADITVSRVCPGYASSHAFCEAISILSVQPIALRKLFVITGQETAGRFTLRFFHRGEWAHVSVDERIVCSKAKFCASCGSFDRPFTGFCHATDHAGEIWMHLIEKALAKLVGSYAHLASYTVLDLLEIMTGGASSIEIMQKNPIESYKILHRADLHGALGLRRRMPESMQDRLASSERIKSKGIVPGIVYAVHGVRPGFVDLRHPAQSRKISYVAPSLDQPIRQTERVNDATAKSESESKNTNKSETESAKESENKNAGSTDVPSPIAENKSSQETSGKGQASLGIEPSIDYQIFTMPLDDVMEIFHEVIACHVFEPERWVSRSARMFMVASGGLTSSAWAQNDQHCLEILEENATIAINVYQGAPARGTTSIAILAHDYGSVHEGPAIPATIIRRNMLQNHVVVVDPDKHSATLEVNLLRGKYVIVVLDERIGTRVEYAMLVHYKRTPDDTKGEGFSFWPSCDVDWQDVDSARDEALSMGATDKLSPAQIRELYIIKGSSNSFASDDSNAKPLVYLLPHLHALAAAHTQFLAAKSLS